MARRNVGGVARWRSDLTISVRDPHRIEPAAYASVYIGNFGRLSPEARLRLLDMTTTANYAHTVVRLIPEFVGCVTKPMAGALHERPDQLSLVAEELGVVADTYGRLYGAAVRETMALAPQTTQEVAGLIEPLLLHTRSGSRGTG